MRVLDAVDPTLLKPLDEVERSADSAAFRTANRYHLLGVVFFWLPKKVNYPPI
jgi:hypothetical protein